MVFFKNISSVKVLNLFIIAVLCFNSLYIILDNLEFDSIEIVDGFDKESKSENEVDEKIEFENEIIKINDTYNLSLYIGERSILLKENLKVENLSKEILIPPPRS